MWRFAEYENEQAQAAGVEDLSMYFLEEVDVRKAGPQGGTGTWEEVDVLIDPRITGPRSTTTKSTGGLTASRNQARAQGATCSTGS